MPTPTHIDFSWVRVASVVRCGTARRLEMIRDGGRGTVGV